VQVPADVVKALERREGDGVERGTSAASALARACVAGHAPGITADSGLVDNPTQPTNADTYRSQ
jgi:hypothetical protein